MSQSFCRYLNNGLVYNNNTLEFTVAPCCYFSGRYTITPGPDAVHQLVDHRERWKKSDLTQTCRICIDMERSGITSYRESSFSTPAAADGQITTLTVAINKRCNLACASCDAGSSSFWYQENIRNNVPQTDTIHILHADKKQEASENKFFELLRQQDLTHLEFVKFGGGEPLMNNTHTQVLNLIKNPEKVTLHYTSNYSILPTTSTLKLWERFKLVKWIGSIDGTGEQFEILRWPYKWTNLTTFIQKAKNIVPSNVILGVEHTINPLTVFYYPEFRSWFDKNLSINNFGDPSDFNIHPCHGIMSLAATPVQVRNIVEQKLGSTHAVVGLLSAADNPDGIPTLVTYLNQLDKWRGTSWRQVFSNVEKYFHD